MSDGMKDFANEMRMTSNFRIMIEMAAEEVSMELTPEQLDKLAEMMAKHFDPFTERVLMSLHEKDPKRAWAIAEEIADKKDTPATLMYEMALDLVILVLANQALLYASLGGLEGKLDDKD